MLSQALASRFPKQARGSELRRIPHCNPAHAGIANRSRLARANGVRARSRPKGSSLSVSAFASVEERTAVARGESFAMAASPAPWSYPEQFLAVG